MAAQPRRIVVGFDGSGGSERALWAALELMGYGSALTVVTVVAEGDDSGRETLAKARDLLLDRLVTASYDLRVGQAADELVAAAHELGADLVAVGRRGRTTPRSEPGSVSADVVRRAPCDVLVVG